MRLLDRALEGDISLLTQIKESDQDTEGQITTHHNTMPRSFQRFFYIHPPSSPSNNDLANKHVQAVNLKEVNYVFAYCTLPKHCHTNHTQSQSQYFKNELRSLSRGLQPHILDLSDVLTERPSQYARRLEDISPIFKNLHHHFNLLPLHIRSAQHSFIHLNFGYKKEGKLWKTSEGTFTTIKGVGVLVSLLALTFTIYVSLESREKAIVVGVSSWRITGYQGASKGPSASATAAPGNKYVK
nr:mediator of RNA polymerase II transcription subunit 7A [Tanacetum cinerariifolium]